MFQEVFTNFQKLIKRLGVLSKSISKTLLKRLVNNGKIISDETHSCLSFVIRQSAWCTTQGCLKQIILPLFCFRGVGFIFIKNILPQAFTCRSILLQKLSNSELFAVAFNDFLIPVSRILNYSFLSSKININGTKTFIIALCPLKVIHK